MSTKYPAVGPAPSPVPGGMSDTVLDQVNQHRAALGHPPLEQADRRELLLVQACAQYGADRWQPGVLQDALRALHDQELMDMIAQGDPDCEHDDLSDPSGAFADVWREAADVANFSMMIADVCGGVNPRKRR